MGIYSLFGRQMPTVALGFATTTAAGAIEVGGIGTSAHPYSSMPSGVPGYVSGGSPVLVIYAGGDSQRGQGLGIPGWVTPS